MYNYLLLFYKFLSKITNELFKIITNAENYFINQNILEEKCQNLLVRFIIKLLQANMSKKKKKSQVQHA